MDPPLPIATKKKKQTKTNSSSQLHFEFKGLEILEAVNLNYNCDIFTLYVAGINTK